MLTIAGRRYAKNNAEMVDSLFHAGNLAKANEVLTLVDPSLFGTDVLIGFLTATLPARKRLEAREGFRQKVEAILHERGEWEEDLLSGL